MQRSTRCAIVVKPSNRCAAGEAPNLSVFGSLSEAGLAQLVLSSRLVVRRSGEAIVRQGDPVDAYYNITAGHVRVSRNTEDGRRFVTGFLDRGDFIGSSQEAEHAATAEAIDSVSLCRFLRHELLASVDDPCGVERALHAVTAHELLLAQDHMMLLGCKKAPERLATFLLSRLRKPLGTHNPPFLDLPMSQTDIADHLGIRLETVSRLLAALRREGVISRTIDHRSSVLDLDVLRDMAC